MAKSAIAHMDEAAGWAPGARVLIREAEWVVRRRDRASTGGWSLEVEGISEVVRLHRARFLTALDRVEPLDPAQTELVPDPSPRYRDTRLYLESLLRQSSPSGAAPNELWAGHRAAVDDLAYQRDPALLALAQPRTRILMADAVGLGKTIEAGILLSELIRRGRGQRILVVTVKSMLVQFQKELWSRFTIPLVRLDAARIERIRRDIPSHANPFQHFDKTIISMDTLKQAPDYRVLLERASWDVIVIDEAQNVAARGSARSQRSRLAALLAGRSDALILTSATPHDGKAPSFASLMNMLDPTAIANPQEYVPDDIRGLFLRRFKGDIAAQVAAHAPERRVVRLRAPASPAEERALLELKQARFLSFDQKQAPTGQLLFKTVLLKSLLSSPAAARATVEQRLRKLAARGRVTHDGAAAADRATLEALDAAFAAIAPTGFSKYQQLVAALRPWAPGAKDDRLVIFTERIETLKFLAEHLRRDLALAANQIVTLHGSGESEADIQKKVEDFGRDAAPVRLLIASDIASEGINLHFLSHRLVHFDIPWSLMTFQQRNGRIDRYGQTRQPEISYLLTESSDAGIGDDLRIIELLTQKDEQAQHNIGGPSALRSTGDAEAEEAATGSAIEQHLTPEQFETRMKASEASLLDLLRAAAAPVGEQRLCAPVSLFADDIDYLRDGLEALRGIHDLDPAWDAERHLVSLTPNEELKRCLRQALPQEVLAGNRLHLSTDRARVQAAIRDCRAEDRAWPAVQLLWELHPVMEWLNLRVLANFGHTRAPVVALAGLEEDEYIFLLRGELPNRRGQPVIHEWFGIPFRGVAPGAILSLEQVLARTGFDRRAANSRLGADLLRPQGLLPDAVARARAHLAARRAAVATGMSARLEGELARLESLHGKHAQQLELELADPQQQPRRAQKLRETEATFQRWRTWMTETLTLEDQPYLQVAALFTGGAA